MSSRRKTGVSLRDPVRLRVGRTLDLGVPRFALSSGTRSVEDEEADARNFEHGAIIATEPWREVDLTDLAAVVDTAPVWDQAGTVCILDFAGQLDGICLDAPPAELAQHCLDIIETACDVTDPVMCHGVSRTPPGLVNATIDPATGKHPGLHVDSWDDLPTARRRESRNRISINLGVTDRYLLFLPMSLTDMVRLAGGSDALPYWKIGRRALEAGPSVPVVKCRLRPGEAYIAPTETLIHDASSLGATRESRHISFRTDVMPRPGCLK
jgi:hypothetical protein